MKNTILNIFGILLLCLQAPGYAAVPGLVNFQGSLLDASKLPRTGNYAMTFRICDSLAGACTIPCAVGNPCLWTEDQNVAVANGVFSVQLGGVAAIDPAVFGGAARYLEIVVAGETLTPRERLTAGSYSFRAAVADSLAPDVPVSSIGVTAVYEGAILDGAVTSAKLAGSIPDSKLSQITTAGKVAPGAIADGALGALVRASSVAVNSVNNEAITGLAASKLTGALPAISGASLTGLTPASVGLANVTNDAQIPKSVGVAKGNVIGFSAAATPAALTVGADDLVLTADSAQATGLKWAAPFLESYNAKAGADVAVAVANTWYTGTSLANVPAGTWLVIGQITLLRNTTTALTYSARIGVGTTYYASAGDYRASVTNNITTLTMSTVITLAVTSTINLQATSSGATSTIKAALVANGAGNNATQITAIRLQ